LARAIKPPGATAAVVLHDHLQRSLPHSLHQYLSCQLVRIVNFVPGTPPCFASGVIPACFATSGCAASKID
jgi:hypothetical protein